MILPSQLNRRIGEIYANNNVKDNRPLPLEILLFNSNQFRRAMFQIQTALTLYFSRAISPSDMMASHDTYHRILN